MATGKKSFVLYSDQRVVIDMLTDEQAGKLLKHLFAYVNDENPVLYDKLLEIAFAPIKLQLKRDLVKWGEIKEVRSEAGKKSAEVKKQNQQMLTNVESVEQTSTNSTVNVNVNDTVNVNVIDKRKGLHLFRNSIYFDKIKFKELFPDWSVAKLKYYYDSVLDWSDSGNNMKKDWAATIRSFERRDNKDGKPFVEPKQVLSENAKLLNSFNINI